MGAVRVSASEAIAVRRIAPSDFVQILRLGSWEESAVDPPKEN